MKSKSLLLAVFVLVIAAGCRQEALITARSGDEKISGQVILGDGLAGLDGITVSARGTGITALTRADGRFDLLGVPAGTVELLFWRESDGIRAITSVSGDTIIELTRNSAKGRPRGVRGIGHPGLEIQGIITALNESSIMVTTGNGEEHEVVVNEETIIRHGNEPFTFADLLLEDQVHVKAKIVEDQKIAVEIKLQNREEDDGGEEQPQRVEIEGIVKSVDTAASTLVVFSSHRVDETITVNEQTVIRHGATPYQLSDIVAGDRVHVKAQVEGDTRIALQIMLQGKKR